MQQQTEPQPDGMSALIEAEGYSLAERQRLAAQANLYTLAHCGYARHSRGS